MITPRVNWWRRVLWTGTTTPRPWTAVTAARTVAGVTVLTPEPYHNKLSQPFDAYCCHMGTTIKHPVPDPVICNFWHQGTLTLRAERQTVRMSKITNDGLTWPGTGCFMVVPLWQQWASKPHRRPKPAHQIYWIFEVILQLSDSSSWSNKKQSSGLVNDAGCSSWKENCLSFIDFDWSTAEYRCYDYNITHKRRCSRL